MKLTPTSSAALVATLLLAGPVFSVPPPDSRPFEILSSGSGQKPARPQPIPSAEDPKIVWRGEFSRTPQDVIDAGGFYPRGTERSIRGDQFTPLQRQQGSSLYLHAKGDVEEFSRFVSASSKPDVAMTYAMNPNGLDKPSYLYMIRPDAKMIDVEASLGRRVPFPGEGEQAFAGFVPLDQVEGWYDMRNMFTADVATKLSRGERLENFVPNPKFNPKTYEATRGSGMQPQLAGFPDSDEIYLTKPWAKFKGQSPEKLLDKFVEQTIAVSGAATGAFRNGVKNLQLEPSKPILKVHGEGEPSHPKKKVSFSENCRRDAAGCLDNVKFDDSVAAKPVEGDAGRPHEEGNGKIDAGKPIAAEGKASKSSGDSTGVARVENTPDKPSGGRSVSSKGMKLIKGLGYLQVAQFLTSVVDSAAYHLNQSSPEELQKYASNAQQARMVSAMDKSTHLLLAVANDTIPGFTELQEHVREHRRRMDDIKRQPFGKEKLWNMVKADLEHCANVAKTLAENFAPVYAESVDNYKKETLEFDSFQGNETAEQRNERIVDSIKSGAAGTANDVLRNYVPMYKEVQDVAKKESVAFLNELFDAADTEDEVSFMDVLGMWAKFQARMMAKSVYQFVRNTVPGEKQLEQFFEELPETPTSVWSAAAEDWASPCGFCVV